MPKLQKVGDVPGNVLGMLSDLTSKLQHGVRTPVELALFNQGRNPFLPSEQSSFAVDIELKDAQQRARMIMGDNFFGPREATKHLTVKWTLEDLYGLMTIPWSEALLSRVKNTHVLVAGYPMSVMDIQNRTRTQLYYTGPKPWYSVAEFATEERVELGWHLVRKVPARNSKDKTLDEQKALLGQRLSVPKTCLMVYAIIGHFLNTGERLFAKDGVRTNDIYGDNSIHVELFDLQGLGIHHSRPEERRRSLGLSASYRPTEG